MDKREPAYAKHSIMAVKNWDTFQAVIRKCLRIPVIPPDKGELK